MTAPSNVRGARAVQDVVRAGWWGVRAAAVVAAPVLAAAVLAGAEADADPPPATLGRAADCADLAARMRARAAAQSDAAAAGDHRPASGWRGPLPADAAAPVAAQAAAASTDGRLIVTLVDEGLGLVDVSGAKPRPRGAVHLNEVMVHRELLVVGTRALVVGQTGRPGSAPATALAVVDLADPDRLRVVARERVEGVYLAVREAAGRARVVLHSGPDLPFVAAGSGDPRSVRAAASANRRVAAAAPAEAWLPRRTPLDRHGSAAGPATPLVGCTDVYVPASGDGLDLTTLLTVDLTAADPFAAATAVVGAGERAYVAGDRFYAAVADGASGSAVHAFGLSRAGVRPVASGAVAGQVPVGSALSAYGGRARVVAGNDLVVLAERRGRLVEAGRAAGAARGTVESVTWSPDRAVLLTDRQVAAVVDLSVPSRPVRLPALPRPADGTALLPQPGGVLLGFTPGPVATVTKPRLVVTSYDTDAGRVADRLGYGRGSASYVTWDPRRLVSEPASRTVVLGVDSPARRCHRRPCRDAGTYGSVFGLVALRITDGGRLEQTAHWPGRVWRPDPVVTQVENVLALPGGRLAVLDGYGCTVLDAGTFRELGHGRLPNPR